jgi:uncharacterized repeat protein (TIGR01451 family)
MQDNYPAIHVFFGSATPRRRSPQAWHPTRAVWRLWCLALLGVVLSVTAGQAQPFAYVPNEGSHTVSVIDTASNTVTATIPVGFGPRGAAVTPDGAFVYVANWISGTASVIDTASNTVTDTILVGAGPYGVAVSPNGAFVYVTNHSGTVSVIDTATNTVTATIPVGSGPIGVAVTPDGAFVYVANFGSTDVSVIDTASNTVTATIQVGANPGGVDVTPDGAFAYVTNYSSNTVSVIDTASNAVTATIPVGANPNALSQFIGPEPSAASADLAITKADSPDPVRVREPLTYTLAVTNNGPSPTTGVIVTDTLPGGVTFGSASASQGSCSQTAGTVTCPLGNLANGASATVTITVTPTATGTLTNTASVDGNEDDPNGANDSDTESTAVTSSGKPFQLKVTVQGKGTVTSSPSGINCKPDCTEPYTNGTVVQLTATPTTGNQFDHWEGGCTGTTSSCAVTMTSNLTVKAVFTKQ